MGEVCPYTLSMMIWSVKGIMCQFHNVLCSSLSNRSYRTRTEHPSTHLQTVPPPAPAPSVYPSPSLYPPPPQPYPPPYPSAPGLIVPPAIGYQPQPIFAPGPPGLNPPWVAPGTQPPLATLPPSLSQPPLSKDDFYRPRHRQDKWVVSFLLRMGLQTAALATDYVDFYVHNLNKHYSELALWIQ